MEKEYWRRKVFITANRLQSATEEGQGRNLEEGAEAEPTRESFFIRLFTLPCSATWLIQCRPTCLEMALPTLGWILLHQLTPHRLTDMTVDALLFSCPLPNCAKLSIMFSLSALSFLVKAGKTSGPG